MAAEKLSMDTIVSLAKRRGFVFAGSEIYGGLANAWDYGPLGVELKNNIKKLWWKMMVQERPDIVGLDSAILMHPKVWQASGHLSAGFADQLVECKKCHERYRADKIDVKKACQKCGTRDTFTEPRQFNLMFKTFFGTEEKEDNVVYLRPETAQGMFVNFKNILDSTRIKPPFGIAQIGKAFRNEITPGHFIFRTREFEQMEIEYFITPPTKDADWQKAFETWQKKMHEWMQRVGIDTARVSEHEVPADERAHYSKRTVDFMFDFPFGKEELYGLAYRGDFDLKNHMGKSGEDLSYQDPVTKKKAILHCIEPTWGVDRTLLAVLASAYSKEKDRIVLKLKPALAPYTVAVFPLLHNKPELVAKAREVFDGLRKEYSVAWDDRGNIGKRYYSQDEIGTPYGVTVDFDSLKDGAVTLRDRDTMKQERVKISEIPNYLKKAILQ
jgi:glycyl-tRNA synthetase